ncbi:MAG: hypothetical protein ACREX0_18670, partial [Noviherbaspirillum sp.]
MRDAGSHLAEHRQLAGLHQFVLGRTQQALGLFQRRILGFQIVVRQQQFLRAPRNFLVQLRDASRSSSRRRRWYIAQNEIAAIASTSAAVSAARVAARAIRACEGNSINSHPKRPAGLATYSPNPPCATFGRDEIGRIGWPAYWRAGGVAYAVKAPGSAFD